jgi:hypothetical protein
LDESNGVQRQRADSLKFWWGLFLAAAVSTRAGDLDVIGVGVLRQVDPTLNGSGVAVAHPEATESTNSPPQFEVNPSINPSLNLFTYISGLGTATNYSNGVGVESGHANGVGGNFYGIAHGVATNVAHVFNYEADYFYTNIIALTSGPPPAIAAPIVNQSFIFANADGSHIPTNEEQAVESAYDSYAAQYNTLFVSGAGNGGQVYPPATCFNGIGVGVYGTNSSVGPTSDGRSKPDLTAPGGATSFSTPYVAGSAAILLQAASRGDGGTNLSAASDARTLKVLLLNGAVKPADWTNSASAPLDARYGAGVVNVFNSWRQLGGGQHAFIESTVTWSSHPHPPGANTNNVPVLVGWDFNTITSPDAGPPTDTVHHYYFSPPASSGHSFTLTATLVWRRQSGQSNINRLNLFLYDTAGNNLVACSTSAVDNVEHLFLPALTPGRYDLQVLKQGYLGQVSTDEPYALAFELFTMPLSVAFTNNNLLFSWPVSPTGFRLEATTNLSPLVSWTNVSASISLSNHQNHVSLPLSVAQQFFRLQRP